MTLTVSKLAERVGLTADTIRYYEREGLLPPPGSDRIRLPRLWGRCRRETPVHQGGSTHRTASAGDQGASRHPHRGLCPCGHTEDLLSRRVAEIDAEIAGLQETKADLIAFTERFNAIECPEGVEPWPCAKEFIAVADGVRREVTRLGRNPVVSADP